jgi:hypothetical protein
MTSFVLQKRSKTIPAIVRDAYASDFANYIYLDAGRPYSVIDKRPDFGHIQLNIPPLLLEAVQRGLKISQGAPRTKTRTCHEPEKRRNARKIEYNPTRPKRTGGDDDVIWVSIALKRSELRRLIC